MFVSGDTLNIPDSVMGLTFLAAGTSVPEAVSSVIVTNQGNAPPRRGANFGQIFDFPQGCRVVQKSVSQTTMGMQIRAKVHQLAYAMRKLCSMIKYLRCIKIGVAEIVIVISTLDVSLIVWLAVSKGYLRVRLRLRTYAYKS